MNASGVQLTDCFEEFRMAMPRIRIKHADDYPKGDTVVTHEVGCYVSAFRFRELEPIINDGRAICVGSVIVHDRSLQSDQGNLVLER